MSDVEEFIDVLYGEGTGYVYVPTKHPSRSSWKKNFFAWPEQRQQIIDFIDSKTADHEVYISPSLFKKDCTTSEITKETWSASRVLWAEFDGNTPGTDGLPVPEPTIRLRSSFDSHEHWYWLLPYTEHDPTRLEELNKRIAYALGADKSGFDYQQVLRPPSTVHHKSGSGIRTQLLDISSSVVSIERFVELPPVPEAVEIDFDTEHLPKIHEVLAFNDWDSDTLQLIFDRSPAKKRVSSSMFRLACEGCKNGMSNRDLLSLLIAVDDKWGKFKGRNDRIRRLRGLIRNARSLMSVQGEDEGPTLLSPQLVVQSDIEVKWVIEDYVQSGSLVHVVAKGRTGKTQFSLWTGLHLAIGKSFLNFKIKEPMKIVFVSLEMGIMGVKKLMETMLLAFTAAELELIAENFRFYIPTDRLSLNNPEGLKILEGIVETFNPVGVMVDSLGVSFKGDINSNDPIIDFFDTLKYRIRDKYNVFLWFIHHNRKATVGNMKPKTDADLFGSVYIYNLADTVFGMWPDENGIEIYCLKMRLAEEFEPFRVTRDRQTLEFKYARDQLPVSDVKFKLPKEDEVEAFEPGIEF